MSRRAVSLLGRLPLAHSRIASTIGTARQFSQSRITHMPRLRRPTSSQTPPTSSQISSTPSQTPPPQTPPLPAQAPLKQPVVETTPLESPATYTSIISHSSSPSILSTALTAHEHAKLANAASFFQKNPQFLYSAAEFRNHPYNEHIPEIVILGASNVGKSTFLNALVGRPGIARTSPRPGHTTVMNAFGVGPSPQIPRQSIQKGTPLPKHSLIVMDTPGYGYRSQTTWGDTIVKYLGARKTLKGAVVLLSSEKKLMPEDKWLLEALADANVRTMVVVTKADKVRGGDDGWAGRCSERALAIRAELKRIQKGTGRDWKEDAGWSSDVFVTAAGQGQAGKASNKAGMGGVRAAVLEMAGFNVEDTVEQKPENVSYDGKIVSFDDIVWKS